MAPQRTWLAGSSQASLGPVGGCGRIHLVHMHMRMHMCMHMCMCMCMCMCVYLMCVYLSPRTCTCQVLPGGRLQLYVHAGDGVRDPTRAGLHARRYPSPPTLTLTLTLTLALALTRNANRSPSSNPKPNPQPNPKP